MKIEFDVFNLSDLFFCERGTRLTKENRIPGNIPLATAGFQNEGISEYIMPGINIEYQDRITIDMFGNAFYRSYSFCCDDNIIVLHEKERISKYAKIYITTVINCDKYRFSYGRQYRQKDFNKHSIKLPVSKNRKPDFEYMEQYIKTLHHKIPTTKNNTFSPNEYDVNSWQEYVLDDLFEIKKGKRLTSADQIDGKTPYIGAIDSNNGVANHIGQNAIHEGNTISLSYNGSVGEAFYQPKPFWATDDVNVLYFRSENGVTFNKYIALFFCAILRQEKYRYSYGRKWVLESMRTTTVKLPTKEGKPDFAFMEQYIKSLPYGDRI